MEQRFSIFTCRVAVVAIVSAAFVVRVVRSIARLLDAMIVRRRYLAVVTDIPRRTGFVATSGAVDMDATDRTITGTDVRCNSSIWGRIAVVATQVTAMLWIGVATAADQPKKASPRQPAPTVEIVPQQEASGERLSSTPSDADLTAVKPLRDISFGIAVSGEAPDDVVAAPSPPEQLVGGHEVRRGFADSMYFWQASNMVHRPLYFEQRYVERYGANFGPMQPVASGVQFAADTALLPAKMLIHPPCECVYSLGYGRPGSRGTRCPRY